MVLTVSLLSYAESCESLVRIQCEFGDPLLWRTSDGLAAPMAPPTRGISWDGTAHSEFLVYNLH